MELQEASDRELEIWRHWMAAHVYLKELKQHNAKVPFLQETSWGMEFSCLNMEFDKWIWNDPPHDKTKRMTCVPSEDSDQTGRTLGIRPVWSESLLCAQWVHVAKDPSFLHADSKDSDQTGQMPRLTWVSAGCTGWYASWLGAHAILLVLSCGSSNVISWHSL